MGVILRLDSKKLVKEFLPATQPGEFQYILISDNIVTRGMEGIKAMKRLLPPVHVMAAYVDDNFKAYKKAYINYLQDPEVEALISIIVKAVVVNDLKLVLLCSKTESDYKYLKMLCEYIEEIYHLKTYTFEEYLKNPEKANTLKDKDEVMRVLQRKFQQMQQNGIEIDADAQSDQKLKKLNKMSKKELRKFAKNNNIKLKDDMDKDDIIKKIKKKLTA